MHSNAGMIFIQPTGGHLPDKMQKKFIPHESHWIWSPWFLWISHFRNYWVYNTYEFTCHNLNTFVSINLLHFNILRDWFFPIFTYYLKQSWEYYSPWIKLLPKQTQRQLRSPRTTNSGPLTFWLVLQKRQKKNFTNRYWQESDYPCSKMGKIDWHEPTLPLSDFLEDQITESSDNNFLWRWPFILNEKLKR